MRADISALSRPAVTAKSTFIYLCSLNEDLLIKSMRKECPFHSFEVTAISAFNQDTNLVYSSFDAVPSVLGFRLELFG